MCCCDGFFSAINAYLSILNEKRGIKFKYAISWRARASMGARVKIIVIARDQCMHKCDGGCIWAGAILCGWKIISWRQQPMIMVMIRSTSFLFITALRAPALKYTYNVYISVNPFRCIPFVLVLCCSEHRKKKSWNENNEREREKKPSQNT